MRFYSVTLGCKVNQYETQAIESILRAHGHTRVKPGAGCDVCVINTCAVTAESARKSRQALRRIKNLEPSALIAVCGCLAQLEPSTISEIGADLIGGSGDRHGFALQIEGLVQGAGDAGDEGSGVRGQGSGDAGGEGSGDRDDLRKNQNRAQRSGSVLERTNNEMERMPEPARAKRSEVYEDEATKRARNRACEVSRLSEVRDDEGIPNSEFEDLPPGGVDGRTRALLKIQDGCDNFCAYCVIPYARGRVRSLLPHKAVEYARQLDERGFLEIVITGIEISSYGKDLLRYEESGDEGAAHSALVGVIRGISAAAPHARLRLGSLDPGAITEAFCHELSTIKNLCDHFHLSLQSGCDETLRRMGRKYSTDTVLETILSLRRHFPECGITADLITGFPGETDMEFEQTLDFIKSASFSGMHIFPFSPRPGTRAAVMPGQIKKGIRYERAKIASASAEDMALDFRLAQIGKTVEVLFERERDGHWIGHSRNYMEVAVNNGGVRNVIMPVLITGVNADGVVFGMICDKR